MLALSVATFAVPMTAHAVSTDVVISQVYGGGGNSGATYQNDFVELYNRSSSPVSLTGWSINYAATTGTSWTNKLNLTGTIAAHGYFLIKLASNAAVGALLPTADLTGTINMSGTAGKVALANVTTTLTGSCPLGSTVVDFVGYGSTTDCREGSANAPGLTSTTSISRMCGYTDHNKDTDQNGTDFVLDAPNPRNSAMGDVACAPTPTNGSTWGSVKVLYR
jgi:predicted extracellular nuclease